MPGPERLLELLLDLPQLYAAQLSAGGRALAWVWNGVDPAPSVWARTPAGRVERMSHGGDEAFLLGFLPGEGGVVYETDPGDERTTPWARPWEGAPERIGEAHPPYFPRGAELHPERPWVFFGANYDFERGEAIEPTCGSGGATWEPENCARWRGPSGRAPGRRSSPPTAAGCSTTAAPATPGARSSGSWARTVRATARS